MWLKSNLKSIEKDSTVLWLLNSNDLKIIVKIRLPYLKKITSWLITWLHGGPLIDFGFTLKKIIIIIIDENVVL